MNSSGSGPAARSCDLTSELPRSVRGVESIDQLSDC
jgi:hypothetical protein